MKCRDFRSQVVMPAADFLEVGGGIESALALRALMPVLNALPDKSVADIAKRLKDLDLPSQVFGGIRVGAVLKALSGLSPFLKAIGKLPAVKDITVIEEVLQRHASAPVNVFVTAAVDALLHPPVKKGAKKAPPVRGDLVDRYARRLEDALGDDPGFQSVFAQLSGDASLTVAELKLLSKRFALSSGASRNAALKKIYARHQSLMTSRARSAATAGRIAG